MAKITHHGLAKPDDPIYSTGLVVGGRRLRDSKKNSTMQKAMEQKRKDMEKALSEKCNEEDD